MKAYKVTIPRFCDAYDVDAFSIEIGETASKVRYERLLDLRDCFPDIRFQDIKVVRAYEYDNKEPQFHNGRTVGWKSVNRSSGHTEKMGLIEN